MYKVLLSSGRVFSINPGENILEAAERAKINLAYSCRTGRCSACKCRVLNGAAQSYYRSQGLTDAERRHGWVLSCITGVTSDVTIDVEDLSDLSLPPIKTVACKISSLELVSANVLKVLLRLPPKNKFPFYPGQYVEVMCGGLRRSYSLACSQLKINMLELHVAKVDGGVMSDYWFNRAKVDDLLRIKGPLGTFFVREVAGKDLVFLATGTGIAPVKAMLEGLARQAESGRPRSVVVYWGGRYLQDLYWTFPDYPFSCTFIPVLSRPSHSWRGAQGYVQDVLLNSSKGFENTVVYACGSDAMISDAKVVLEANGLSGGRFYSDAFVCSAEN